MDYRRIDVAAKIRLLPHFPELDMDRIQVRDGIPWIVRRFAAVEPAAYTSGSRVYFAVGRYDPATGAGIALIAHELVHCRQFQRHGKWMFRLAYLLAYLRNRMAGLPPSAAYRAIPFEQEARDLQARVLADFN